MSDRELDAALGRFDVPPLSAGFTDRVMAAAQSRTTGAPLWAPRGGRGSWSRRAGIIGGGFAFSLLSAAAAATGYLGEPVRVAVRQAPVIGPIIARVDPPKARLAGGKRAHRSEPKTTAPHQAIASAQPTVQQRREAIVASVRQRIERRREERAALGLPPQRPRVALRQAIREMPPEERRALIREYREVRRQRIAERWRMRQERRARWLEDQRRLAAEPPVSDEGRDELDR